MESLAKKYPKYYKELPAGVKPDEIDTYVINRMFPVEDPTGTILHARKKLLIPGVRSGGKSMLKDIIESRDTLNRYIALMDETVESVPEDKWRLDGEDFLRLMAGMASGNLYMQLTKPGAKPAGYSLPLETFHAGSSDIHFWPKTQS